jgi:hypothetical protein
MSNYYVGLPVHKASICIAVLNATDNLDETGCCATAISRAVVCRYFMSAP